MLSLIFLPTALATWSIVAVDPETGDVGATGATCGHMVGMIGEVVPDQGAVVAQFATNLGAKREAADALEAGQSPTEILDTITDPDFDDQVAIRQYGIVSLNGDAIAFTGADNDGVASTLSGTTWSVQGNTLRSDTVISAAADALQNTEGPLEMRLMAALEAGADQGGDKRCPADAPAKSAFLTVARAGDARPSIDLNADPLGSDNPIPRLREKLEADGCQHAPITPAWFLVIGALGLRRSPHGRS